MAVLQLSLGTRCLSDSPKYKNWFLYLRAASRVIYHFLFKLFVILTKDDRCSTEASREGMLDR